MPSSQPAVVYRKTSKDEREEIIDIARGFAMLFVCLSHFASVYLLVHKEMAAANVLSALGMLASPSFVCLSGTLVGIAYVRRPKAFAQFQLKLADRALFLLSVGHVLMLLSVLPAHFDSHGPLGWVFITDAIAFCLLLAPWIMTRLTPRERVLLGVVLLSVSWLLVDDWQPRVSAEVGIKGMLFGETDRYWFPIIPWLGIYLASTAFGEHLGAILMEGDYAKVVATMARVGGALVMGSALLGAVHWAAAHGTLGVVHDSRGLESMTSVWQKYPPGVAYVLLFGGLGIALDAVLVQLWRYSIATSTLRTFAAVGRSSLLIYVLQAQVYYVILHYVRLPRTNAWPLVLVATLVPLAMAARWWSARGMNRYLTVGLPTLVAAIAARRDALLRTGG